MRRTAGIPRERMEWERPMTTATRATYAGSNLKRSRCAARIASAGLDSAAATVRISQLVEPKSHTDAASNAVAWHAAKAPKPAVGRMCAAAINSAADCSFGVICDKADQLAARSMRLA